MKENEFAFEEELDLDDLMKNIQTPKERLDDLRKELDIFSSKKKDISFHISSINKQIFRIERFQVADILEKEQGGLFHDISCKSFLKILNRMRREY